MPAAPAKPKRQRRPPTTRKRDRDDASRVGPRQWAAIEAELRGDAPAAIWAALGVSRSQWYRWHDPALYPHFVAELNRARRDRAGAAADLFAAEMAEMVSGTASALRVLRMLFESDEIEPRDRIRASAEYARAAGNALALAGFAKLQPASEVEVKPEEDAQVTGMARVLTDMRTLAELDPKALEPQS